MFSIIRATDPTTCNGIAVNNEINVRANMLSIHRIGDQTTCASCAPPTNGTVITGSLTVRANGIGITKVGNNDTCGGVFTIGSPNVRAS